MALTAASIYDIFGMLQFMGKNSNVSDVSPTLVLGMDALWNLYCFMSGPIYQPGSQCGDQYALSFGIL